MTIYVNGLQHTSNVLKIRNLGISKLDGISIHIEPKTFLENISGFNETTNSELWILQPKVDSTPKLNIKIDNTYTYPISNSNQGNKYTNPIVYKRHGLGSKPSTLTKDSNGSDITIQFVEGSDNSIYGSDWIRLINSGIVPNNITSLPSSGNIINNKVYFEDHFFNENNSDYIQFEVIINETVGTTLYNNIITALQNCNFVIQQPMFSKSVTNSYELLYNDRYEAYSDNESNIRY